MSAVVVLLALLSSAAPSAVAADPEPVVAPTTELDRLGATDPVAKVNGVAIPRGALDAELGKVDKYVGMPPARLLRTQQNIVTHLIEAELIRQAIEKEGIVMPEEDLRKRYDEFKQRFQSEEQFNNYLAQGKITKASIEQRIRERRLLELLLEKRGGVVSDAEARDFYDMNRSFYIERAGVRASHVFIEVAEDAPPIEVAKARARADNALARIKNGEDFAKIADEMSDGRSAPKGGDLGFFGKGRMVAAFEEVAFELKVGEVSGLVRTRFGFHIIKVFERREERTKPFDEVKPEIVASLANKKFFTERRKLIDALTAKATIERFFATPEGPDDSVPEEPESPSSPSAVP